MAIKKQPPLSKGKKIKLAQEAAHNERLPILAKKIDENLALTEQWRAVTEEHKEIILFRLSAGDTIKRVCDQLGISSGAVYMLRHIDEEFAKRFAEARKAGADALVDQMRDVSRDPTLTDARAALEFKALAWIAARTNKNDYGEQVKVEHTQTPSLMMPDWMGNIVEGQIIPPPSGDPLDTDEGNSVE